MIDQPLGAVVIKTVYGRGYSYIGLPPEESGCGMDACLPPVLTKTNPAFTSEEHAIHREQELSRLTKLLSTGKTAVLIHGFGGIGKTSIARVLYSRAAEQYDCVGWVEYRGSLKRSFLAAMDLDNELESQDKRWARLKQRLKNDKSRKIIFIDNVDRDAEQDQDPLYDEDLRQISGWPNLTLVLTSRLAELPGYTGCGIGYLGDRHTRKK